MLATAAIIFVFLTGALVTVFAWTSSRAVLDLTQNRTVCVLPETNGNH